MAFCMPLIQEFQLPIKMKWKVPPSHCSHGTAGKPPLLTRPPAQTRQQTMVDPQNRPLTPLITHSNVCKALLALPLNYSQFHIIHPLSFFPLHVQCIQILRSRHPNTSYIKWMRFLCVYSCSPHSLTPGCCYYMITAMLKHRLHRNCCIKLDENMAVIRLWLICSTCTTQSAPLWVLK